MPEHADLEKIIREIESVIAKKSFPIVFIDGNAAAGKTTLADHLQKQFGALVVHMDDFYLPRDFPRISGEGNSDLFRIRKEILEPFSSCGKFLLQKFDPSLQKLGDPAEYEGRLLILEGTYSLHPQLQQFCDLSIWMGIDPDRQWKRLEKRDPGKLESFKTRWLPNEKDYIFRYDPASKADLSLISF